MPFADVAGAQLHYRFDGAEDAPVVMLSNSLGTNLSMWDGQLPALARRYRVLRYDSRGHGQSAATPGPYTIEQLARDALGLLDSLDLVQVSFCGLSMGGMVGQWLGANAAQRVSRLVLCNTAARIGTAEIWNARIDAVNRDGMAAIVEGVVARWYSPSFIAASPVRHRQNACDAFDDPRRGIRRLVRRCPRHGSARIRIADRCAHARHRRSVRHGDIARRWPLSRGADRRCALCRAACGASVEHRGPRRRSARR